MPWSQQNLGGWELIVTEWTLVNVFLLGMLLGMVAGLLGGFAICKKDNVNKGYGRDS